jgi:hypothetical protein
MREVRRVSVSVKKLIDTKVIPPMVEWDAAAHDKEETCRRTCTKG